MRTPSRKTSSRYALARGQPKAGAIDFLEKPFDDENLLASLKTALDRSAQQSQRKAERAQFLEKIATLSNRERDVLEGLIAGKANAA